MTYVTTFQKKIFLGRKPLRNFWFLEKGFLRAVQKYRGRGIKEFTDLALYTLIPGHPIAYKKLLITLNCFKKSFQIN